jgi:uncharacterized membrane protein YkoI
LTAPWPDYKVCDAAKQGRDTDVTDAAPIRRASRALAALAVASLGFGGTAAAQPPGAQGLAPGNSSQAQLPQRRQLTLGEAIQLAQSRYPGRVVRAQTIQTGNGAVYDIRIIGNDGRVHNVTVDARTGAVH